MSGDGITSVLSIRMIRCEGRAGTGFACLEYPCVPDAEHPRCLLIDDTAFHGGGVRA